jgi:uncharacterized membrane protein YfcA
MPADTGQLLIWLVPLLLLAGAVAGVLAGLLGVGGGIVIVPALFYIFGYLDVDTSVRMHLAVGTSLATIIPTSVRSMRAHQARGSFDGQLFRAWMPALVAGVVVGSGLAGLANTFVLTVLFAVVALLVSLHMAFGRPEWRLASQPPRPPASWLLAGCIGSISAMMGIGGGTLSVPSMSLFGVPIHRAVGTSAGFGLLIALAGTLGFMLTGWGLTALPDFSVGYVNWLSFLLIVPATVLFVPLGARLAHSLSQTNLRRAFAFFLALTALRMLADVFRLV